MSPGQRPTPRRVALDALARIDEGAYANLVLGPLLARSGLDERDRGLVTDLVYGTTRMRRACDFLVDRFVYRPLDGGVRRVLRLGAYQIAFARTPAHAAVSATVAEAPGRARGLVNAVLRRVAAAPAPEWPDEATRLSYPDWIVDRLRADLGTDAAISALEAMNRRPAVSTRSDGYVQDEASRLVAEAVGVEPGERVADLCAAPGGKATWMASEGPALVAALDIHASRAQLLASNAAALARPEVAAVVADARRPPLAPGVFDRVLVDAPCSGLGALGRRPDARWRVTPADVDILSAVQRDLLVAAAALVRPGGLVVYSVCTLTRAETVDVARWALAGQPGDPAPGAFGPGAAVAPGRGEPGLSGFHPVAPPDGWEVAGEGGRLLPQQRGTDGMFLLRLARETRR